MKVLITGANGTLGNDLAQYSENIGLFIIPLNKELMDITNKKEVYDTISKTKPDLIIHCAGYTNVEKAEIEKEKAYNINVIGSRNIAKAANLNNSTLIYISTNYVFDGKKDKYNENDTPNPINYYGYTKLEGEKEVQKHCKKSYIARTSWLYGENGEDFIKKILSNKENSSLKIVDDEIASPTWTFELSKEIYKLLSKDYGIYHICSSKAVSRYDFAKEIIKLYNLNLQVIPCKQKDLNLKAKRPKNAVLNPSWETREWRESLKEYFGV